MLNNKELNEKIEAFISPKGEKLNAAEKNKLKETEKLMKKYFSSNSTGDLLYFISLIKNYEDFINYIGLENLENKVIETKNAECIAYFARYIKEANIEKLENVIIETKCYEYIIPYFALHVKGANIEKLENAIIETKNAKYIYCFAKYIKGAGIEKLENAIIETNDAMYIYLFAKDVKGANLYKCLYKIKELNLQSDFSNFEISLEKIAISRDLENIHGSVCASAKEQVLTELINNRYENNNEIKLRIYYDYLSNPCTTSEDLNKCDREYLDYMCSLEEEKSSNKKKVKIRKKRVN